VKAYSWVLFQYYTGEMVRDILKQREDYDRGGFGISLPDGFFRVRFYCLDQEFQALRHGGRFFIAEMAE